MQHTYEERTSVNMQPCIVEAHLNTQTTMRIFIPLCYLCLKNIVQHNKLYIFSTFIMLLSKYMCFRLYLPMQKEKAGHQLYTGRLALKEDHGRYSCLLVARLLNQSVGAEIKAEN